MKGAQSSTKHSFSPSSSYSSSLNSPKRGTYNTDPKKDLHERSVDSSAHKNRYSKDREYSRKRRRSYSPPPARLRQGDEQERRRDKQVLRPRNELEPKERPSVVSKGASHTISSRNRRQSSSRSHSSASAACFKSRDPMRSNSPHKRLLSKGNVQKIRNRSISSLKAFDRKSSTQKDKVKDRTRRSSLSAERREKHLTRDEKLLPKGLSSYSLRDASKQQSPIHEAKPTASVTNGSNKNDSNSLDDLPEVSLSKRSFKGEHVPSNHSFRRSPSPERLPPQSSLTNIRPRRTSPRYSDSFRKESSSSAKQREYSVRSISPRSRNKRKFTFPERSQTQRGKTVASSRLTKTDRVSASSSSSSEDSRPRSPREDFSLPSSSSQASSNSDKRSKVIASSSSPASKMEGKRSSFVEVSRAPASTSRNTDKDVVQKISKTFPPTSVSPKSSSHEVSSSHTSESSSSVSSSSTSRSSLLPRRATRGDLRSPLRREASPRKRRRSSVSSSPPRKEIATDMNERKNRNDFLDPTQKERSLSPIPSNKQSNTSRHLPRNAFEIPRRLEEERRRNGKELSEAESKSKQEKAKDFKQESEKEFKWETEKEPKGKTEQTFRREKFDESRRETEQAFKQEREKEYRRKAEKDSRRTVDEDRTVMDNEIRARDTGKEFRSFKEAPRQFRNRDSSIKTTAKDFRREIEKNSKNGLQTDHQAYFRKDLGDEKSTFIRETIAEKNSTAMVAPTKAPFQDEAPQTTKRSDELPLASRTGGVYIPPFKLARLQKEISDKTSPEYQRQTWEALRKSLNGLVNKVNVNNIMNLIPELFHENLIRGRGLFARALIRAQMASPGFTHIYVALLAIVNSKLPEIGELIIHRVILQFRRSYRRNDKIVCLACVKFIAHLVNQKIVHELLALQLAALLLEKATDDSIEVAVGFIKEVGQVLSEISKRGFDAIFERLRAILQEGESERKTQYTIEKLWDLRRRKFRDYPGVIPELDLVDEDEQITHEIDLLDETIKGDEMLNIFKAVDSAEYGENEAKWTRLSQEILGEDVGGEELTSADSEESSDEEEDLNEFSQKNEMEIRDFTEQDSINLRKAIYLTIMSSVNFEECVHKILKLNIKEGQEIEVITMLIDCCAMERTFQRFFALQAERLARLKPVYAECLMECFRKQYATVHRLETNKLRNTAKFFSLLLSTEALPWTLFDTFVLTDETTTSSGRIFIKILFQELAEDLGLEKLNEKLQNPSLASSVQGIFPTTDPKNIRFAINFFTAIGLGGLTDNLRELLASAQQSYMRSARRPSKVRSSSSSSSGSSDSSGSSNSSNSSDASSSASDDSSSESD